MNYNGREHAVFAGSLFFCFYGWVFFCGRLIIAPTAGKFKFAGFLIFFGGIRECRPVGLGDRS